MSSTNYSYTVSHGPTFFVSRTLIIMTVTLVLGSFVIGVAKSFDKTDSIPEELEVQALLLKDASGHRWGLLGINSEQEPMLLLTYSADAMELIIALMNNEDTPNHAVLHVASGKQYAEFAINDKLGSFFHATDNAGNPRVVFSTKAQEALGGTATKWGKEPRPTVYTMRPDGSLRSLFVSTPKGGICEVYNTENKCIFRSGATTNKLGDLSRMPELPVFALPVSENPSSSRIGAWDFNTYGGAQQGRQQGKNR